MIRNLEKSDKHKKLINKLKSNFCMFMCKDPNYECVSYNVQQHEKQFSKKNHENYDDNFETLLTPKLKTNSRNRMPIYYKTPMNKTIEFSSVIINGDDDNDDDDDDFASTTTLTTVTADMQTQNTHKKNLANAKSPSISQYPYLIMSPENTSNTKSITPPVQLINKSLAKPKNVQNDYYSPNISSVKVKSFGSLDTAETDTSSDEEILKHDVYEKKVFEIGSICACYIPYCGKYDGDLTIKFAERLQIIGDDGEDYILVKNLSSKAFGYVPRDFIVHVNEFLNYLI